MFPSTLFTTEIARQHRTQLLGSATRTRLFGGRRARVERPPRTATIVSLPIAEPRTSPRDARVA